MWETLIHKTDEPSAMTCLYDFSAATITGQTLSLACYRGQVLVIVNVASHCGLTPQYRALETLHRRYCTRGFAVLGFPCNQFGAQEPGGATAILTFCRNQYDVSFPLFAKIAVNGARAHPLYRWLKHEQPGVLGSTAIKWNFTKFLIDRDGRACKRYAPVTKPETLQADIVRALA